MRTKLCTTRIYFRLLMIIDALDRANKDATHKELLLLQILFKKEHRILLLASEKNFIVTKDSNALCRH